MVIVNKDYDSDDEAILSPRRILLLLFALLLLLAFIFAGLSAFARENTTRPPISNYLFDNGWIDSALADGLYQKKAHARAEQAAGMALQRNLSDTRAIRILALAKEAQNDLGAAEKWLEAGNRLGWRDSATQAKLFEYAVRRKDFGTAIDHVDALLRRRVASDQLVGVFLIAAQDDKLSADVAGKLVTNPSWRPNFFYYKQFSSAESQAGYERIVRLLKQSDAPATREEISTFTNAMTSAKKTAPAFRLWNELFPGDNAVLTKGKTIDLHWPDGDRFQNPLPVSWVFIDNRKATPILTGNLSSGGASLELEMDDDAIGRIASRVIILPAGELNLSLPGSKLQGNDLTNIAWSVSCLDGSNVAELTKTEGKALWTGQASGACTVHLLNLELRNRSDRRLILPIGNVKLQSAA